MTARPASRTSRSSSDPVSPEQFAALVSPVETLVDGARLAVAVSGGADSMALLRLLSGWVKRRDKSLTALTVDHGLRPESANEAKQVGRWCAAIGVPHVILNWIGEKPARRVQEEARRVRYDLMEDWCVREKVGDLFVAHTQNDQAETFLFRMSRGSGPDGLAAMPLVSLRDRVRLVRPLLTIDRQRVEATLRASGQDWVEDPGNADRRYARVRIRQQLPALKAEGISIASMAGAARIFGRLRAARDRDVACLAEEILVLNPEGYAEIDRPAFAAADPDVSVTLMTSVIACVGGRDFAPKRARSSRLWELLVHGPDRVARTLGGCGISASRSRIRVWREPAAISESRPVTGADCFTWDGRFLIDLNTSRAPGDAGVSALGRAGWEHIANKVDDSFRRIPGPVRYGLPAIRRDGEILQVWHFQYRSPQMVENIIENAILKARSPISAPPFWVA